MTTQDAMVMQLSASLARMGPDAWGVATAEIVRVTATNVSPVSVKFVILKPMLAVVYPPHSVLRVTARCSVKTVVPMRIVWTTNLNVLRVPVQSATQRTGQGVVVPNGA